MAHINPRLIELDIEGSDRSDEVASAKITSGPGNTSFLTFEKARNGGNRRYSLVLRIAQDAASGTLWNLIWTGAGTLVEGTFAPYGNATPSLSQPHYDFEAIVSEPDGDFLGGDATVDPDEVAEVTVTWVLTGKPTPVTSGA